MELREFIRSHIEDGKPIVELDSNDIITHSEEQKTKEFDKLDDISKEIMPKHQQNYQDKAIMPKLRLYC